jgi:uncharacterized protein
VLLDTSGLLCYLHQNELKHQEAMQLLNSAKKPLTHSYVLAELIALALIRRFPRARVLSFVMDLLNNPDIQTIWVDGIYQFQAVSEGVRLKLIKINVPELVL